MSSTTARLALIKPSISDFVDVTQIDSNADKLDLVAGSPVYTSGTRPGSPFTGQLIWLSDLGRLETWNGTAWIPDATYVQVYEALGTDNPTLPVTATTAATAQDVAGASVTFTTTYANTQVEAIAYCDGEINGTTSALRIQLDVDGTDDPYLASLRGSVRANITQSWKKTLASAGSHTLKLQAFKTSAADTVVVYGLNGSKLIVKVYNGT